MSAELKVILVGDDPQQQQAFNNPQGAAQAAAAGAGAVIPPPIVDGGAASKQSMLDSAEIGSVAELTEAIQKLTDQMEAAARGGGGGGDPPIIPSAPTRSGRWLSGAKSFLRRKAGPMLAKLGKTRAGRGLARAGGAIASRLGARAAAGAAASGAASAGAGAAGAAGGGAAGAAAALGAVALPAAAVAAALAAAAVSVKAVTDAFQRAADELEDLSPAIATVRAQFDANRQLATLDRAQRVGAELAQIDVATYRISESMYEVQTKILEILVKAAPFIEAILDAANAGVRGIDAQIALINYIWSIVNNLPTFGMNFADDKQALDDLKDSLTNLNDAVRQLFQDDHAKYGGIDPFFQQIINMDVTLNKPQAPNAIGGQFP